MKRCVETILVNENGNEIRLSVSLTNNNEVLIEGTGPASCIEHVWTIKEALALHKLLGKLPLPKLR